MRANQMVQVSYSYGHNTGTGTGTGVLFQGFIPASLLWKLASNQSNFHVISSLTLTAHLLVHVIESNKTLTTYTAPAFCPNDVFVLPF